MNEERKIETEQVDSVNPSPSAPAIIAPSR
jgi:hypothetical protein